MKASPERERLEDRLKRLIAASGPITVSRYMAEANAHYYATRDPFGASGDFVTAPEISQMFGEMVGLWLADLWLKAERPEGVRYVELGPGRGTLAADALRAMASAGLAPPVEFVETSPVLRAAQAERVPGACWHEDVETLPQDGPLLIVANEFFDALPVRQMVSTDGGWRERLVGWSGGRFVPEPGDVFESSPASADIVRALARRIAGQRGAMLIIDYGHERTAPGETLQAVSNHGYADPWVSPGERDLTAHVDFQALAEAARGEGARIFGPREQGLWLTTMGIDARASALAKVAPHRAEEIAWARERLVGAEAMGALFKAMAVVAPGWPAPEGF